MTILSDNLKYKRMLCWVRPEEKKDLLEIIHRFYEYFPIVFAKNYEDFKLQIQEGDYLVFSIVKASKGFQKCLELVRNFPNLFFHLYYRPSDDGFMTCNEFKLFKEPNIVGQQYMPGLLIEEFETTFQ